MSLRDTEPRSWAGQLPVPNRLTPERWDGTQRNPSDVEQPVDIWPVQQQLTRANEHVARAMEGSLDVYRMLDTVTSQRKDEDEEHIGSKRRRSELEALVYELKAELEVLRAVTEVTAAATEPIQLRVLSPAGRQRIADVSMNTRVVADYAARSGWASRTDDVSVNLAIAQALERVVLHPTDVQDVGRPLHIVYREETPIREDALGRPTTVVDGPDVVQRVPNDARVLNDVVQRVPDDAPGNPVIPVPQVRDPDV